MRNFVTVHGMGVVKTRAYQRILLGILINSLCLCNDICREIPFALLDFCIPLTDIDSNEFYREQQTASNASICPQLHLSSNDVIESEAFFFPICP